MLLFIQGSSRHLSISSTITLKTGTHFVFTGIDGAGKSTQAGLLAKYVRDNFGPTYLSEPRTDLISQLMVVLAWQYGRMDRREYFGHYAVDFAKAFDVVRDYFGTPAPLLAAGMHVIEPRSSYCRLATSIGMYGKRDERIAHVLGLIPKPDLLFWLDTEPDVAFQRITARGIDTMDLDFLEVFCNALRSMPEAKNWVRIDGNRGVEEISQEITEHVAEFFKKNRLSVGIV